MLACPSIDIINCLAMTRPLPDSIGEFPVVHFRHPEHLGGVALIGLMHAQPNEDSYRGVLEYVRHRQNEGGVVHTEGIYPAPRHLVDRADNRTRKKLRLLEKLSGLDDKLAEILGMVTQNQSFCYFQIGGVHVQTEGAPEETEGWITHDCTMLDIATRVPAEYLGAECQYMESLIAYLRKLTDEQRRGFVQTIFDSEESLDALLRQLPPVPESPHLDAVFDKHELTTEDVFLRWRNEIAVRAVGRAAIAQPHRSITLLWGEDHVPGISRGLQTIGYQKHEED